MECLFNQRQSMVDEEYEKYGNSPTTSLVTKSGREIPFGDIPLYHIHSNLVVRTAKFWEKHVDTGLRIKGKVEFMRLYGFNFYDLRNLEREGFIKIKQLSKNPYNIEIQTTDKKYELSEVLEDLK